MGPDGAGAKAAHGGMEVIDRDADPGAGGVHQFFDLFIAAGISGEQLGRRAYLDRFSIQAGRLAPAVFAVVLEFGVLGPGLPFPGMQALIPLVPGMGHVFLDVGDEVQILVIGDDAGILDIAPCDDPAR